MNDVLKGPAAANSDSKLRKEFVGMMFAVAVAEIGLQAAAVVRAGDVWTWGAAYSHLSLSTFVVAMSWVGWSLSAAPGARKDIDDLFEWDFVILLLDVAMVVTYFILVRTVNFSDPTMPRIESAAEVASWIAVIFLLYLLWDVVTKFLAVEVSDAQCRKTIALRIAPTLVCFGISVGLWQLYRRVPDAGMVSADIGFMSLVVLFRAAKGLTTRPIRTRSWVWTAVCIGGLVVGTLDSVGRI